MRIISPVVAPNLRTVQLPFCSSTWIDQWFKQPVITALNGRHRKNAYVDVLTVMCILDFCDDFQAYLESILKPTMEHERQFALH